MALDSDAASAALDRQTRQLETLDRLAGRFGRSLSGALTEGAASGRQLSGVLDGVAASLVASLGRTAGSTLAGGLTSLLQDAARSLTASLGPLAGALPFASGGVLSGGRAVPFASGGVVASPTYFPLRDGLGLAGERGAEAILPLARGPDGRLGVRAGPAPAAPAVTVNISTPDAESFRRSEAQVAAALARAVARGRRAL